MRGRLLIMVTCTPWEIMSAERAFRFRSGRLSLDFAATLEARYRQPVERLTDPAELVRWIGLAVQTCAHASGAPRSAAPGEASSPSEAMVASARELREAIRRLVHPLTRDAPQAADIAIINDWASRPGFSPVLGPDGRSVRLWSDDQAEAGLAMVARDAIDLLSGPLLARVRECEHPDCSVLFADQSRPNQRRWCDMESCGNLMKGRRHRLAHAAPA
jgi:predicted RNA-binding Zn ribbon-like protein